MLPLGDMMTSESEQLPRAMSGSVLLTMVLITMKPMKMPRFWLPDSMLISESHVAPGAIQILVACAATSYHGEVQAWAAAKVHVWVCAPTAARVRGFCGTSRDMQMVRVQSAI